MAALSTMRLEANYLTLGVPARMVFHFRKPEPAVPLPDDCRALAQQYGLWENNGFLVGYFLLRSFKSGFTAANVWSIDNRSTASFIDNPFFREGFIPDGPTHAMCTGLAPLVQWKGAADGRLLGRTYAVGLTDDATVLGGDSNHVSPLYQDALITIFQALRDAVKANLGFDMVHVKGKDKARHGGNAQAVAITRAVMSSRLLASQRRRLRPDAGFDRL